MKHLNLIGLLGSLAFSFCIFFSIGCKKKDQPVTCKHTNTPKDSLCKFKNGVMLFHRNVTYFPVGHLHPSPPVTYDLPDTFLSVAFDNDVFTIGKFSFKYSGIATNIKCLEFSPGFTYGLDYQYETGAINFWENEGSAGDDQFAYWAP